MPPSSEDTYDGAMALVTNLIADGLHHALAAGDVVAGAGFGEVAGVGAAQLIQFLLPYEQEITARVGFEDQFYVTCRSTDGNITAAVPDAVPFATDPVTGLQIARLLVDVAALPANVSILFESHHSAGR